MLFILNLVPLGYGVVYPIIGTFKFNAEEVILKPGNRRVVKIETYGRLDRTAEVQNEYNGLLNSEHLHTKPLVFTEESSGKKSYLVMNKAPGIPLETLLHPIKRAELPDLTLIQRFELTFALLKAIKEQVADKKMIHRDIKPLNLIVNLDKTPPEVNVIDYGFNLYVGQQDYRMVGTRAYRPMESFADWPVYSSKSDVYSAGRVLSYIWGDDYRNYYFKRTAELSDIKKKSTNEHLFYDSSIIFDLSKEDQIKIRSIINHMMNDDPDLRFELTEYIKQFSEINTEPYKNIAPRKPPLVTPPHSSIKLKDQIKSIQHQLIRLKKKAVDLSSRGHQDAANVMINVADELDLNTKLLLKNPKISTIHAYRTCCLKEINRAKITLQNHRDSWWIVGEIAAAISLLGVGYLVAIGINYLVTNRVGLFTQTHSDKLIDDIKQPILNLAPMNSESLLF